MTRREKVAFIAVFAIALYCALTTSSTGWFILVNFYVGICSVFGIFAVLAE